MQGSGYSMGLLRPAAGSRKCSFVCDSGSARSVAGVSWGSALPGPLRAGPKRDSDLIPVT